MNNNNNKIMELYTDFIAMSRYARWQPEKGRRETWPESVSRFVSYMRDRFNGHDWIDWEKIYSFVLNKKVMPSMRLLSLAGPAADQHNAGVFNCSYLVLKDTRAFGELLYLLACGSGVGFSVESRYINHLPKINGKIRKGGEKDRIIVEDSREGWGYAIIKLMDSLFNGIDPEVVTDNVRGKGAPLKTFGGRASGPEPLMNAISGIKWIFYQASRRPEKRLRPIEAHDIACMLAEAIIFGGVRRSAMISLSDLRDREMALAKSGKWYIHHPYRQYANNSAVFEEGDITDVDTFSLEFETMRESGSGERGIFSRPAARRQTERTGRRDPNRVWGTNPCSEIILRPFQQCNLTEAVVRSDDTPGSLIYKVEVAALLGVLQSTFTDFNPIMRRDWKLNAEEERLLGVSLTGIYDNKYFSNPSPQLANDLEALRDHVVRVSREYAERLGINTPTATTAIKPSGTVSQLVNSASGIHPRYAKYYIRRVRMTPDDPITRLMVDSGIPHKMTLDRRNVVFEFPVKAPDGAITRKELNATEHLLAFLFYQDHWCEHKPSITIQVKSHEWEYMKRAMFANLEKVSGIALLPYDDTVYELAPYEEITEETYNSMTEKLLGVDSIRNGFRWERIAEYEEEDRTSSSREFACTGSSCEIVGHE